MNNAPVAPMSWRDRLIIVLVLTGIVAVLFHKSFTPGLVMFSSDGPLGILAARDFRMPDGFTGFWIDTNWFGTTLGSASPTMTYFLLWLLGPVLTVKFLPAIFVLVLGLSAAFFFRILGFRPMVCLLGGIAAELNSNFFSNACWGVGTRCSTLAATFLALAAIWSSRHSYRWLKLVLAGFATGFAVMEGADNGAIFSLYIAAFALFVSLLDAGAVGVRIVRGLAMVAVVAAFAGFISYQAVKSLIGTQITGHVGMEQTTESKEERWPQATQWSLPKIEILRVIVPGLFGYRMDTPEGGEYWGRVGEVPGAPQYGPRSSGAGEYAGVLVVLVAIWAFARSCSRKAATFTDAERKLIWFWAALGFVSVLFAWGRHAPFYRLLYNYLPFFSTIRNPMKFMHPAHMTLMILFGYGLQGLAREYLDAARATAKQTATRAGGWWANATTFEKLWTIGSIAAVALGALGWLVYSSSRTDVVRYMNEHFVAPESAPVIARFSIKEVALFVFVLLLSAGAVLLIQMGVFRGPRAVFAGVLLGVLLTADLARAATPWIVHFDYKERYASNPVIDLLKENRWEHRVTVPPFQINQQFAMFQNFYRAEWLQHQFQYYNIQTMELPQEPRMASDKAMYLKYVGTNILRYWELSNTRYIFGVVGLSDMLNQQLDPAQRRFRPIMPFTLAQKPGTTYINLETNLTGPFTLNEFSGALPRAKLYSRWQVDTNDASALTTLSNVSFNPHELVIVDDPITAPPGSATNATPGKVEYVSYEPKKIVQRTTASTPTVLLLNDRYDPDWTVTVDGQPARLLRCNFIVRGVELPAGEHTVTWSYQTNLTAFYVSLSAVILAVLLAGLTGFLTLRAPREKTSAVK